MKLFLALAALTLGLTGCTTLPLAETLEADRTREMRAIAVVNLGTDPAGEPDWPSITSMVCEAAQAGLERLSTFMVVSGDQAGFSPEEMAYLTVIAVADGCPQHIDMLSQ